MKIISIFENIAIYMKQTTIIPLLFLLICFSLFGQIEVKKDTIAKTIKKDSIATTPKIRTFYLDENSVAISEEEFNLKCMASVFYCREFNRTDSTIFKVYHQMYFGKLTSNEYNQLRIYLNRKSIKKTPENHKILIHYEESLVGFKESNENCNLVNSKSLKENYEAFNLEAELNDEYPFESIKNFQRYVRIHRLEFHDEEKFNNDVADYAKQQNSCIKKIETKYQTPVYYVVNDNYNYPIKNDHFTWIIDGGAIKNTFVKNHPDTDFILIKPNGEYFIKSGFMPNSVLNKLLKHENWEQFKNDWTKSIQRNYSSGYGIVRDMTREYEYYTSSCF